MKKSHPKHGSKRGGSIEVDDALHQRVARVLLGGKTKTIASLDLQALPPPGGHLKAFNRQVAADVARKLSARPRVPSSRTTCPHCGRPAATATSNLCADALLGRDCKRKVARSAARHERGENPSTAQEAANRKKRPKRKDYGYGLHVEYSPANAAYFVMWHHEVLSIRPTWEAADEHARSLVANKSKDAGGGGECAVGPSTKKVSLRRTQSGEPPVVEHYKTMEEAVHEAKRWIERNPPGEHGRITIESREGGGHSVRVFKTVKKNSFEWRWAV